MTDPDEVLRSIDDGDEWGEPVPARRRRKSEKRRRGVVVSVRLSPAEFELLESKASKAGMALGTFMRERAVASAAQDHVVTTATWVTFPNASLVAGNMAAPLDRTVSSIPQLTNAG